MSLSSFSLAPGHRIDRWHNRVALPVLVIVWLATAPAAAQTPAPTPPTPGVPAPAAPAGPVAPRVITLDDALGLAEARNEQIAIAEAGVSRAIAGQARARSERMPQLGGSAAYDRTLQSEFSGIFDTEGDEGADFSELPFGQPNAYHVGLSFSQLVWSGGRVAAQEAQARLGRDNATIGLASTRAQLALDVAQAFYESALADRLVGDRRRAVRAGGSRVPAGSRAARSRPGLGVRAPARPGRSRHDSAAGRAGTRARATCRTSA